jgi:hypothetical protein
MRQVDCSTTFCKELQHRVALPYSDTLSRKRHDWREKVIQYKLCVFWYSVQLVFWYSVQLVFRYSVQLVFRYSVQLVFRYSVQLVFWYSVQLVFWYSVQLVFWYSVQLVFWYSVQLVFETFLVLRRIQRHIINFRFVVACIVFYICIDIMYTNIMYTNIMYTDIQEDATIVSCFITRSLYMFRSLSVPIIRSTLTL